MMYITHMLLVWQYFYLKLTIRDNGSSIWNHGTTINFGLSGIMVLLFHMVLLMIGAKIHYGTCIPYTPSIQDLRVSSWQQALPRMYAAASFDSQAGENSTDVTTVLWENTALVRAHT